MTDKISRSDFLKVAGAGVAATAVLTGCGPASRYVIREPYSRMPEYTYNGQSTYYATTCRECPAGCGIIVRTMQGRAIKIEGNPNHPVNLGKTCARGQAALQGLYNPDRIQNPVQQKKRKSALFGNISWDDAVNIIKDSFTETPSGDFAFLLGLKDDHLFDLVSEISKAFGAPAPIRFGAQQLFEARSTLVDATRMVFNYPSLPFFDLANADVAFSFGANFLETYLSPVAYSRGFANLRRGKTGKRGYLVQFEPRLSQTASVADEWFPISPGTEGMVALALGRLITEKQGSVTPNAFVEVDVGLTAERSGVSEENLHRLAEILAEADRPLIIPGGSALGQTNGLETAQAILAVNVLLKNIGEAGGLFLTPALPVNEDQPSRLNSFTEVNDLVQKMKSGKVNTLFIHGINPLFELPVSLGFEEALAQVPQVISFASFPDETAMQSDFIFPDHTSLESWGYQKIHTGSDRAVISGSQPVVAPFYSTQGTADVLLASIQSIGGDIAKKVPYKDIVEFLRHSFLDLVPMNGFFNGPEINTFMAQFQQYGGWWSSVPGLIKPGETGILNKKINLLEPEFDGEGEFILFPFLSPILGDGSGANKPWLQETPDPTTTVMWNSWVEINPDTADELGLQDDDVIRLNSPYGIIEAVVYRYPAIRPDVIAIPFGQGHTVYGRYAEKRGANPVNLLGLHLNGSYDLTFASTRVSIEKTGRTQALSRNESRIGVYGEGLGE
ncbi:MAG: molybdopterin-dependent oxidoreductase [Chloroflexota bacterium]